jgi:signal transduction histidine kinase
MFWSTRDFIRQLERLFGDLNAQSDLLHHIDRLVLDQKSELDAKLRDATQRFSEIIKAKSWSILFPDGNRLFALYSPDGYLQSRQDRFIHEMRKVLDRLGGDTSHTWFLNQSSNGENRIANPAIVDLNLDDDDDGTSAVLIIPVSGGGNAGAEPFCFLAPVEAGLRKDLTALETEDVRKFAVRVATQVDILVQRTLETKISAFIPNLYERYFSALSNHAETTSEALSKAVEQLSLLLPNWAPFDIDEPPIVQLLSFSELKKPLILRAAGGGKPAEGNGFPFWKSLVAKPVPIKDSICGLYVTAVKKGSRSGGAWVINPKREHPKKFKSFQGDEIPESEMVVGLFSNNNIVGVLNFEHLAPNVFTRYHVETAEKIAQSFTPFLTQIEDMERQITKKEKLILATVEQQAKRIRETAEHKSNGSKRAIVERVNLIKLNRKDDRELMEDIDDIRDECLDIIRFSLSFISNLPDFIASGKISLYECFRKAIENFDYEKKGSDGTELYEIVQEHDILTEISIDGLTDKSGVYVYASELMQEHIYNLINNAHQALKEENAVKGMKKKGRIQINVEYFQNSDDRGKPVPGGRVVVSIADNGPGVDDSQLLEILKYNVSSKKTSGGMGFGLPAARDYFRGYGGNLSVANGDEEGFIVQFYLQEYSKELHGDSALFVRK